MLRDRDNTKMTLEEIIGYTFTKKDLLRDALTHPSAIRGKHYYEYERLEFLGDRVLGLTIAEWVYKKYTKQREGILAQKLAVLASRDMCHKIAVEIGLENHLQLNKRDCEGTSNTSVLSNTMEALLGAIYLDGGLEPCVKIIKHYWEKHVVAVSDKDPKSFVQEWSQKKQFPMPTYTLLEKSGREHSPMFKLALKVKDNMVSIGEGASKRQAEHDAAKKFIKTFIESKRA